MPHSTTEGTKTAASTQAIGNSRNLLRRVFVTRGALGRSKGSGAPAAGLIAVLVLALVGLFAFAAAPALAASPTFTVNPAPTVGYTTAQVSGTVDPEDNEVFYWFQYSQDPELEGWTSGPEAFAHTLTAGSGSANVSETLTGLKSGTTYEVRLLAFATSFSGEEWASPEPYVMFTTEPVVVPTVTLDPITTHTGTTAHFSGTVDPNAPAGPLSPAAEAAFKTEWHFACTPECPGLAGGSIEADEGSQTVSVDATGLEPNTSYEVTLEASNAGGPASAGPESFQTTLIPAAVKAEVGSSDGKGGFILRGAVNPHNSEVTACRFEYGPTTGYDQSVPCEGVPGAANKFVEVTGYPTGLTPGATYHYQLVATNGAGPAESGDSTFTPSPSPTSAEVCPNEAIREEQGTTDLPECRAYELVTSPYKEGFAPVGGEHGFSFTEGAFSYTSSGNFAGDGLGSTYNSYVATRSETGWLTTSLDPSGPTYADGAGQAQALSTDLRSSLWQMRLPDESTDLVSYYLHEPDGTFTRIGPALNPATAPPGTPGIGGPVRGPRTAAVSADLSHMTFEVEAPEAFPGAVAAPQDNLYEYVGTGNERPQLVGVDNAGNEINSGGTCSAGMSTDGRVVFFEPGCGEDGLWARINGTTTIDASASECTRTSGDPGGACNAPAEVGYAGAASDGSRMFFTTTQQLVNGDTNQTSDLYACDIPPGTPAPVGLANRCESLIEVSGASATANVEGVVSVSADGSRVYFIASGVLASNTDALGELAVIGDHNLYVSQIDAAHPAGQTTFIAKLQSNDIGYPQTTADGRYLVFTTTNQLLPSDTDEVADVYRYDADTGSLLRLSTDTSGTGGNTPGLEVTLPSHAMTAGGSTVVFQTNEALSPADTNGTRDVYEWHEGRVSLISSGRPSFENPTEEKFAGISPSGMDIYFTTTAQLTANDRDTDPDIYDARINGGFSLAQPQPCSGEACQGAPSSQPPAFGSPGSAAFSGAGNLAPPVEAATVKSKPKPKPKSLTRAQKLAKALKACKSKHNKKKRSACEKKARNTYGRGK